MRRLGRYPLYLFCLLFSTALAGAAPGSSSQEAGVLPTPNRSDQTRLIPLSGALNVRDLGGLSGAHGPLPYGRFIRAADLSDISKADRDLLVGRGVTLDIDLRTTDEIQKKPDAFASDDRVRYIHISLMDDKPTDLSDLPPSLEADYAQILDTDKVQFHDVFAEFAHSGKGAVIYHCTGGKDRTGIISAVILELAGVSRNDIVHNYAISAFYLKPALRSPAVQAMLTTHPALAPMMTSPPHAMASLLGYLDEHYGGAEAYLLAAGLSSSDIAAIREHLSP
jgi:protein-tyrosine phosphatase